MCELIGRNYDIACDDIIYKDLNRVSVAGMDAIARDDLAYDVLNPECVRLWDGLPI